MKKIISLILLVAILQGARITQDLERKLNSSSPHEYIKVNLVLEKQLNGMEIVKNMKMSKKAIRNYVKNALKEFARETQAPILEKLKELEKRGLVRNIKSLWIANVINFEGKKEAIYEISKLSGISSIDYDEERYLLIGEKEEKYQKFAVPDETSYPLKTIEWNILKINAPEVWAQGYKGQGVIVAVLDTGVRYTHLDLADHIWINTDEIPNNGLDDDGNGYIDDYLGWDTAYGDNNPSDGHGHGTHVAGTVAGEGIAGDTTGVAPEALIMCVKVLTDVGGGTESGVWEGMQYAADNGADIITMSLGWRHAWNPDRATWRNVCVNINAMGV
ncbi:MAG: S8 family serine peptidase, partial [candidate division WOR-3 bacterium]